MSDRWLSAALLVGCASKGPTDRPVHSPPDDAPRTAEELVEQLEDEGALPALDRTDSVGGIDADDDGIRDDVEAYIDTHFPPLVAPARQLAAALQSSLLVDRAGAEALGAVAVEIARAVDCVQRSGRFVENMQDDPDVIDDLQSITANTKRRMLRYVAFNAALAGTLSFPLQGEVCD